MASSDCRITLRAHKSRTFLIQEVEKQSRRPAFSPKVWRAVRRTVQGKQINSLVSVHVDKRLATILSEKLLPVAAGNRRRAESKQTRLSSQQHRRGYLACWYYAALWCLMRLRFFRSATWAKIKWGSCNWVVLRCPLLLRCAFDPRFAFYRTQGWGDFIYLSKYSRRG